MPGALSSVEHYRARRHLVAHGLNAVDGLEVLPGDGAFYVFVNCAGVIGRRTPDGRVIASDDDLVAHLLDAARVATINGSAYGLSPYFRISFATSEDTLRAAVAAITDAISALEK